MTVARSRDGYNPCPDPVLDAIAAQAVPAPAGGTLLDACAGEGGAATRLASAWNLAPSFVELDPVRAEQCAARGAGPVLVGSAEDVVLDGAPTVWYFNPPWDPRDPDGYLEQQLFFATSRYALTPQTFAVILLPARMLEQPDFFFDVAARLDRMTLRAFPDPYFEAFNQLIFFGYGRARSALGQPAEPPTAATIERLRAGECRYELPASTGTLAVRHATAP